jgi:hypothetical protein
MASSASQMNLMQKIQQTTNYERVKAYLESRRDITVREEKCLEFTLEQLARLIPDGSLVSTSLSEIVTFRVSPTAMANVYGLKGYIQFVSEIGNDLGVKNRREPEKEYVYTPSVTTVWIPDGGFVRVAKFRFSDDLDPIDISVTFKTPDNSKSRIFFESSEDASFTFSEIPTRITEVYVYLDANSKGIDIRFSGVRSWLFEGKEN